LPATITTGMRLAPTAFTFDIAKQHAFLKKLDFRFGESVEISCFNRKGGFYNRLLRQNDFEAERFKFRLNAVEAVPKMKTPPIHRLIAAK